MTDPTPLLSSVLDRSGDVEASAGTFIVEGRHEGGRSTLADSTWNLCNIILGAGLFALPRVFAALGLLGGVFMTVLVAVLSYKTIALMLRASEASGEWTYGSVLERLWGHKVARGVHVAVIVGCAGFVTLYIIVTCDVLVGNKAYTGIIADLFPSLPDVLPWYLSRTALITWITLAIAPLLAASTLHGMAAISAISVTASSLSMLCLLGMALGAILQGTVPPIRWLPDLTFFGTRPSIIAIHTLAILPVVMTAFICHMSIHPLAQDLEGYTPRRMRMVVAMSLGACCTMYAGTGAAGYSTFGEDVAGDVLANVQPETVAELFNCSDAAGVAFVATLKSCVAVAMLTSVPLSLWPARADILELMTKVLGGQPSKTAFYIVTYASLAAIYVGAVAVESSYSMVALIGATCGIALAFVFPGMISMRLAAVEEVDDRTARRQYVNGVMLLIIGGILTAAGVTSTIIARGRE